MKQHTLAQKIQITGIGLHSGAKSAIVINPAKENFGIVFERTDLPHKPQIAALYNNIIDTRNCSCLGNANKDIVSTIEHLMSSLYIKGIDNALIETNCPELPIMDGSAKLFYEALQNAELTEQVAERKVLKVLKEVSFTDDKGNFIKIEPAERLTISFAIDFPSKIVGHQEFNGQIDEQIFREQIAPSRTFCEKHQVDYLKSIGLIKGGSLENAVVLDGENILNEGGFRVPNECVNHKVLDVVGDLYTSGYRVLGKLIASKTGHFHTNELLKKLLGDKQNYELV